MASTWQHANVGAARRARRIASHRSSRSWPRRTQYTSTQLARRTAGMGALSTCTPRRWSLKITPVHQLPNESSLCSHNQRGCGCMGPPCTDLGCTSPHTPIRTQPKVRPDTRRAGPRAIRPMHARAHAYLVGWLQPAPLPDLNYSRAPCSCPHEVHAPAVRECSLGFGEAGALDVATVLGEAAAAWGPPVTEADCAPHTPMYTRCPLRKDTRRRPRTWRTLPTRAWAHMAHM